MTKKTKIFLLVILILVGALLLYIFYFRKENGSFAFYKVEKGDVLQSVSETGKVKESDRINLGFERTGRIEKIYVKEGDSVKKGAVLAKLDNNELVLELNKAQKNLELIQAEQTEAEKDAYKDAQVYLDDAYLKMYNSFTFVSYLKRTYFDRGDMDSLTVFENKNRIERALESVEEHINKSKESGLKEDIDLAVSKTKESLSKTKNALAEIREIIEGTYRDIVSDSDKSTLDTHRQNINTAISNILNAEQEILNAKLEENSIDKNVYQAKIEKAQAEISLLESKIQKGFLRSPVAGKVVEVFKKEGEVVNQGESVISLLPSAPFYIEVNIYEEDIVKIKKGDPVEINIVALPQKTIKGEVSSIDPAEKIIEGVVYYKVTISFKEEVEGVKPGMTADITIKTQERKNVLRIPKELIEGRDGKKIVKVAEGKEIEEREIKTGLEGNDFVEVLSGLKEGEKIIVEEK